MLEKLRKRSIKNTLVWSIIMFIIGFAIIIIKAPATINAIAGYERFENLEAYKYKDFQDQMLDIELNANFGCFLEEYEYNNDTHDQKTTHLYYIILNKNENSPNRRFMAIKVPYSYMRRMEKMADNTYEGYYSDPISFSGHLRLMTHEEQRYFKQFFVESGWTSEEILQATSSYCFDVGPNKIADIFISCIILGAGLLLIVIGIVRICRAANGTTLKDLKNTFAAAGCTEATAEADYIAAIAFTKNDTIKIGRLFTYYMSGAKPKAIPNSKIMWAYQTTTTHRTNGIKTGTTYSAMIYVEGMKGYVTLSMPSEATTQALLQEIQQTMPWVVVGYSEDLKYLFNKDRAQFLSLRYNTVEHIAVDPGFTLLTASDTARE